MIVSQELHFVRDGNFVYTTYNSRKLKGYLLERGEVDRHGLRLHFEWYCFRFHLTVEVQPPPEGYTYSRLMYRHNDISAHNYCRTGVTGTKVLYGSQFHQIQSRFWLPRIFSILFNPDKFRAVYSSAKT